MSDERLDALYEGRERDEVPDETPMTDEEIEEMFRYFHSGNPIEA